jgi:hypothetical protein
MERYPQSDTTFIRIGVRAGEIATACTPLMTARGPGRARQRGVIRHAASEAEPHGSETQPRESSRRPLRQPAIHTQERGAWCSVQHSAHSYRRRSYGNCSLRGSRSSRVRYSNHRESAGGQTLRIRVQPVVTGLNEQGHRARASSVEVGPSPIVPGRLAGRCPQLHDDPTDISRD